MTFSSAAFLFLYLPVVFILYQITPTLRAKNILLAAVSVFFYAFGEPVYVLLLLLSVTLNYILARMLGGKHRKAVLTAAIMLNVLMLGIFKYAGFAAEIVNLIPGVQLPVPHIVLPIGISFYTFQILSYVIDVYRGDTQVQKNYWDLLFYISFFPQLIAGPIVKYHDIDEQIRERSVTAEKCAAGICRFTAGLAKKMLLSNTCGWIADAAFGTSDPGTALAWLGAFAYCLQIYHDFSGYSDMAIGLGAMFGFDIPENFRYPYASGSIKEFWRRWHISLSTWFKEYIYIPLGGSRAGTGKMYRNKLIVFFTTGLWHGASWNFIFWGLWHGAFSILEEFVKPHKRKWLAILWRPLTLFVILFGFVLFRAETLADTGVYLHAMFSLSAGSAPVMLARCLSGYNIAVLILAAILSLPVVPALRRMLGEKLSAIAAYAGCAVLFIASVVSLASSTFNPFIYFRF